MLSGSLEPVSKMRKKYEGFWNNIRFDTLYLWWPGLVDIFGFGLDVSPKFLGSLCLEFLGITSGQGLQLFL